MRTNGKWIAILCLSLGGLGCDEPKDGMPDVEDAGDDEGESEGEGETDDEGESEGEDPGSEGTDLAGQDCSERGQVSPCGGEGMFNVCDDIGSRKQWGACHQIECVPGESEGCAEFGSATCELSNGVPYWVCEEGTPLVLSFDGAEPVMSDASAAAAFDVGTGGACIQTDWPAAETPWLALDRDLSGTIDGGHELFGSGTVLAGGKRAQHGFLALAELDSNGDGRITQADARFEELVLWADHDRNKRSTHAEHEPLSTRGIVSIELGWRNESVCDEQGNCGVERAAFSFVGAGGRVSTGEVIDVHLPCR